MPGLRLLIVGVLFQVSLFLGWGGSYTLTDGSTFSGEPISYNESGVIIRTASGIQPRTAWDKFTQDALKQLLAEAKNTKDAGFVEPFIEEVAQAKAKQKEIVIRPVERPELPKGYTGIFAMLSSPLGLVILLLVYAAGFFAAREISLYTGYPAQWVFPAAVVLPFCGPAIFLFLPRYSVVAEEVAAEGGEIAVSTAPAPNPAPNATAAPIAGSTPGPSPQRAPLRQPQPKLKITEEEVAPPPGEEALPPAVTLTRGQFTFNRRFFETKMPGFFRVVPAEAEKDLVLAVQSARGNFVGKRITNINQTELFLQIFKDGATADEMIPFTEIQEVEIRHKNA